MIHLGDFLQLRPTAQLSLLADTEADNDDGESKYQEVPPEAPVSFASYGYLTSSCWAISF